jgi:hypothetical protein
VGSRTTESLMDAFDFSGREHLVEDFVYGHWRLMWLSVSANLNTFSIGPFIFNQVYTKLNR